jgi:GT2 family glycosyltransferase
MDLSIIIVTHNHSSFIKPCLLSVAAACRNLRAEVFVIDNRSTDGSAAVAKQSLPSAVVIENAARRGFAANSNIGLAHSQGRYALLLNPDTVVCPGALDVLL